MDKGCRVNHRYRILRKLGEGGMGSVYLAADELEGDMPVALKLVHEDAIGTGAARAYFRQEFEALAALAHPNIARVFDFGVVSSVEPAREAASGSFFTSEYVDGQDLYRLASKVSYDVLCEIVVQVLRALSYIHSRGLIHYDVKPSNILVALGPVTGTYRAKLLDFGLVGHKSAKLEGIKGTVRYLAPEVAKGSQFVDERADLYSLGVTLYQVVTRKLPFEGDTSLSVIRKHLERPPDSPRVLREDLPASLEAFVLRLLAKEPADRYPSADAAIVGLARLTGEPFEAETRETRESRILSGRFVGRERELARLRQRVREATDAPPHAVAVGPAAGLPRVVLLAGEAGIGKSRLLRELKHSIQLDGIPVLAARAGGGSGAWSPWPDVLRQALRLAESLPGGATLTERNGAAHAPLLSSGAPDAAAPSAAPAAARRAAGEAAEPVADERNILLEAVTAFLFALAARRSFVVALDGLEEADGNAVDLLTRIARTLAEKPNAGLEAALPPLVLFAGFRTDEPPPAGLGPRLAPLVEEDAAEAIHLERLPAPAVAELIRSMTGGPAAAPAPSGAMGDLGARLAAETGGNPFFVEEVMKALAEEGAFAAGAEGAGAGSSRRGRLPIPATVSEALARRLARVPPEGRRVLEALAVLGPPAEADWVAEVVSRPLEAVIPALVDLERKQLVVATHGHEGAGIPLAPAAGCDRRFAIHAGQARDLVLEDLPPERAAVLHRRALDVLEKHAAHRSPGAEPDLLALHARRAGDRARSIRYSLEAASRARAVYANDRALAAYGDAIELLVGVTGPAGRRNLARALAGRGEVALVVGENELAERDFELLVALVTVGSGPPPLAQALLGLGRAEAARGDAAGARATFEHALAAAREPKPPQEPERAPEPEPEPLDLENENEPEPGPSRKDPAAEAAAAEALAAEALREIGNVEFSQGRYAEALEKLGEAHRTRLELAASRPAELDPGAIPRVLHDTATCLLEKGDYERALACARESLALEHGRKDGLGVVRSLRDVAQILYYRGAFDEALAAARETIARSEAIGYPAGKAAALNQIGHIVSARGPVEDARRHYEEALKIWRRIDDRPGIAAILNNLGCIADTLGEFEGAVERYRESASHFEALGFRGAVALAHANLAFSTLALGRLPEAEAEARRSLELASEVGNKRIEIEARRALAEVRMRRGDPRGALEPAERAASDARGIGNKLSLTLTLATLAPILRGLGRLDDAGAALGEALRLAGDLGERSLEAAVRVETARLEIERGRFGSAFEPLEEARKAAHSARNVLVEVEAERTQAELYLSCGEVE